MEKSAMLQEILSANPKDVFARYALAMEFAGRDDFAAALREFGTLLENQPDYVPGYFMAAQTLARAGRREDAAEKLRTGIGYASAGGNLHAQREMQAMLDDLELDA